jgi:hypothetical protein
VIERLDPNTGTTVAVLADPVQLVTEQNRGPSRDPFAFVAPFQIDRMGTRQLLLWVSVPQDNGPASEVQVLCDDTPLALSPTRLDLAALGLTKAPYARSAPWSGEWYFELPDPALRCLSTAHRISTTAHHSDGADERFSADGHDLSTLAAFAARYSAQ